MRFRTFILIALAALLAFPMAANAGGPRDKATGGGQVLFSSDGKGAGNTIAFTAQNTGDGDAAKGQVQYVNREAGTGQAQTRFHGVVTCLRVEGKVAQLSGTMRNDSTGDDTGFIILVEDNGQGAAADDDLIGFQRIPDPSCDEDDGDDDARLELARGNAQVHDAE